jgi:threonine dehydrogenase-like Zn-dependent dehydrogenase
MHEVVGEVVVSRHPDIRVGSRVVGWAVRSDALAEYVVTDGDQLAEYDAGLDPEQAVLIQSLACVMHPLEMLPIDGAHVAIIGLGPIGLLFAHVARAEGAATVIGVDEVDRSDIAREFGLTEFVHNSSGAWASGLADHERPGIVIEAVGHQVGTLQDAITASSIGGRIFYFGIPDNEYYPLDMEQLLRKNLTLQAGITRDRARMLHRADSYLGSHPQLNDLLVTHVMSVEDIQLSYLSACVPSANRRKIVITMH